MVKYQRGDVLNSGAHIIAHGCNCVGGFGSGVAGQIVKRFPVAAGAYQVKHETMGWKLGDVQFAAAAEDLSTTITKWIANCATQQEYYPRNKVHANYDAIRTCMEKVKKFAMLKNSSIAIPKIGAGLAGGDWIIIEKILEEVFYDYDVTVYVLE